MMCASGLGGQYNWGDSLSGLAQAAQRDRCMPDNEHEHTMHHEIYDCLLLTTKKETTI